MSDSCREKTARSNMQRNRNANKKKRDKKREESMERKNEGKEQRGTDLKEKESWRCGIGFQTEKK
jgi:hypothetical protein